MKRNLLRITLLTLTIFFASCEQISTPLKAGADGKTSQAAQQQNYQRLEIPEHSSEEDVVEHIGYTTSYNHTTLVPNWVAYELTQAEAAGELPRDDAFAQDPDVHGRQAELSDYKGSGWDRGHMAPAADMKWSADAMRESFLLSNMCPQDHALNAGSWEKTEKMGRRLAEQYGKVYIVCGPIFGGNQFGTIGANRVSVPDAFFKAFLIESNGEYAAIGFMMENISDKQDFKSSTMPVDNLEKIIGRDLFPNLPDSIENVIEAKIVKKYWGI